MFVGHSVVHASEVGLARMKNGELLRTAAETSDVFVTIDKKIRYEHAMNRLPISVIELATLRTRFVDLVSLEPFMGEALLLTQRYRFVSVRPDGSFELLAER